MICEGLLPSLRTALQVVEMVGVSTRRALLSGPSSVERL